MLNGLFSQFKKWWIVLIIGSILIPILASKESDVIEILARTMGILLMSGLVAAIPWLFYRVIRKPMTPIQFMSTYTVVWIFFAISQFIVSLSE